MNPILAYLASLYRLSELYPNTLVAFVEMYSSGKFCNAVEILLKAEETVPENDPEKAKALLTLGVKCVMYEHCVIFPPYDGDPVSLPEEADVVESVLEGFGYM